MTADTTLLTQSAEWRLLGLLFECPDSRWRAQIGALAREVADPLLQQAARTAVEEASEGDFHSIFGPGGPAAPREASYHETVQLGYLLSEITAYYNAFCFQPDTLEAIDHVSVEAGFVSYLYLKLAFAQASSDSQAAGRTRDAAAAFLRDHLSRIGAPLAAALANSGIPYLASAGQALAARTGPPPASTVLPILVPDPSAVDSSFDCGPC